MAEVEGGGGGVEDGGSRFGRDVFQHFDARVKGLPPGWVVWWWWEGGNYSGRPDYSGLYGM